MPKKSIKETKKSTLSIPVYDLNGKVEKNLDLTEKIFAVDGNSKLLSQYVRVYLSNQRQGTASTKTRGEVAGTTKKIYKQKGTGRARHGAKKAPIFIGGGVTGGPKPKDYSLKMNKKQKRKALFYSLSQKLKNNSVLGLVNNALEIKPKTKLMSNFLNSVDLKNKKILLVLPEKKGDLFLASRNLKNLAILPVESINAYSVMKHEKVLFTEKSIERLTKHFLKENES
ncbi:MAG: 50S ribosomal protein L4 [Candidatus Roizmanbacteria bacterium]|nr:MAG: 50S ribosomal protein L4 [Candidatus Roizmanbacteria bacterium]